MKESINIKLQISEKLNADILLALEKISQATGIKPTRVDFIREAIAGKLLAEQINTK